MTFPVLAGLNRFYQQITRLKVRRLIICFLILCGLVVAAVMYEAWNIYAYDSQLGKPVHADAAIVLGAAAWGEQPSPVFRERINYAVMLYQAGYVRKIIFTGAQDDTSEPAEAVVAQWYALEQGVPETDILLETGSRSTRQNLYYARQIAREHQLGRFLIVSDPLHLKRAVLIAQDLGMDAYPAPTPTTRYRSLRSQLGFLARETYYYVTYLLYRPFV